MKNRDDFVYITYVYVYMGNVSVFIDFVKTAESDDNEDRPIRKGITYMSNIVTSITNAMKLYGKELTKAWENGSIMDKKKK
ncbi:hypothetical protein BLL40_16215 [Domibacillus mangrovi]|uniref:Uncharacterized protein n=1 Tax=Domibacillus mangrovi TaxID=1714354 RepID=A0A1Q5NZL3_9BACI|nr:hypothetical protein BLL40_16215 [Domibacillus mangrovi]